MRVQDPQQARDVHQGIIIRDHVPPPVRLEAVQIPGALSLKPSSVVWDGALVTLLANEDQPLVAFLK